MSPDSMSVNGPTEVLRRARTAVDDHWILRASQGHLPNEHELTGHLLAACDPRFVRYAQFTVREERQLGSDWLWWFLDASGECLGLLIQAKRLHRNRADWTFGLNYRSGGEERQIDLLLDAADLLDVPAAYLFYCGPPEYRAGLECADHRDECDRCPRMGASILDALTVEYELRWDDHVERVYAKSAPLEDLLAGPAGRAIWFQGLDLNPDLREFLVAPQTGVRAVARRLLEVVALARMGQFSATVLDRVATSSDAVFEDVPADRGHLARPYLQFVLRGLRREPPSIVEALLADDEIQPHASLAGMVVVTL